MKIPKLRFKGFTDKWEIYKLKDFSSRVTRKNKDNISQLPLTISAQDGLVDQTTFFNKTVASKDLSGYYLLHNGDFAYNKSYSNGYPWGTIKRLDKYDMGVLSTLYICFKPNDTINSDFLVQLFNSTVWYNGVSEIAVEGARNHGLLNISVSDFFETTYNFPSVGEQTKIANFLSLIDRKIELQEELVKNLQLYNKGLLQKVFSNSSSWKTAKIESVTKYYSSNLTFQSIENVLNGEFPIYDANGICNYISTYQFDFPYIAVIKDGAGVGRTQLCNKNSSVIGTLGVLKSINCNLEYLYYAIQTINLKQDVVGTTIPHIYYKDYKNKLIPIPSIDEQTKIANLFTNLDKKIDFETKKLENLKQYKKGLLQKIFI